MKNTLRISAILLMAASGLMAESIHTGRLSNVAISGYDTVAFFIQSKAVRGNREYSTSWMGVDWYFSSQENLQAFLEAPDDYAPRYGGHCANGLASGYNVGTNPENWLIYEGDLYLFWSAGGRRSWNPEDEAQISGEIESAWHHWERLK
jgi:YHS domain-containing protein